MTSEAAGTRVRVLSADQSEDLGLGTIVGYHDVEAFGHEVQTPEILLDDGETVFGYETWWAKVGSDDQ